MKLRDLHHRHQERHASLDLGYAIANRIDFLNGADWDAIATGQSLFLSREYLRAIEAFTPANLALRYAILYRADQPILILACQIADIRGEQLIAKAELPRKRDRLLGGLSQRMLICGNLVSSGLHGVAFAKDLDSELGWRAVAEALYRIRRSEKLEGSIDFVMIKDLKGELAEHSKVLERYSYRPIKTDPDMVIQFPENVTSFEAYLGILTSKYRSRLKKVRKDLLEAGFQIQRVSDIAAIDARLHELYLEVEKRASVQLATLAPGYFTAMAQAFGSRFRCTLIERESRIAGFIVTLNDLDTGYAYYVGIDYELNERHPIYFGLLQLSVEDALEMGCRKLSLGRTALEPKANHGAKPVETLVWMRHRTPLVNFTLRQFYSLVPYDEAPERSVLKSDG